jgi:hypothetical protein
MADQAEMTLSSGKEDDDEGDANASQLFDNMLVEFNLMRQ